MGGVELWSTRTYSGWTSHFWPPMFSFIIGISNQFISGFLAGKLISVLSSTLILIIVWFIAFHFTHNQHAAFLSQLFVAINPIFALSSIQVENHMLDTLFFISSAYFLIKSIEQPNIKINIILMAIFTALATLTRYTSYTLIPLIIISFLFYANRKYFLKNTLIFTAIFLTINMPWYHYNYTHNGSILHTWQYMNIGSHVIDNITSNEWWWSVQNSYSSLSQIIFLHPFDYILNFTHNILHGIWLTIKNILFIVVLFLYILITKNNKLAHGNINSVILNKHLQLLLIGYFGYLTLVSQAFVFSEVFLSWIIIFTILLLILIQKSLQNYISKKIFAIIAIIVIVNLGYTYNKILKYVNNADDHGQLADYQQITDILKKDIDIKNATIMSIHPARAYCANAHFISAPLFFNGTVEQLVKYDGLSQKIIAYAPKYPFVKNLSHPQTTYLIYDKALERNLPQYAFLFKKKSSQIPTTFHLVYASKHAVVYKINSTN